MRDICQGIRMRGIEPYGRIPSSGNPGPGYPVLPIARPAGAEPEGFGSIKTLGIVSS